MASWAILDADDDALFAEQGCILDRLLSIRDNRVVGYRVHSLWQVLNAVLCEKETYNLVWHTLYLTALKVYVPSLRADHQQKIEQWRASVLRSLLEGESTYRRNPRFDAVLGFLLPEMASDLNKPLPGGEKSPACREPLRDAGGEKNHAPSRSTVPVGSNRLRGHRRQGWWLEGEELDEWKRRNPEAAKVWEQCNPIR